MKEDRKLMQTMIFIVFVYKYVDKHANHYSSDSIKGLNSKLGNANCVKIEKRHLDVSFDFKRNFIKIYFRKSALSSIILQTDILLIIDLYIFPLNSSDARLSNQ